MSLSAELFFVLVAIGVVLYIRAAGRRGNKPRATEGHARLRGNGQYSVEVVGESHYAANFERILGAAAGTEDEQSGDAELVLEDGNPHDPLAVAVVLQGLTVGYLARHVARDFRRALKDSGLTGRTRYAVGARVYAGGPERLFSVTLDLPET